MKKEIIINSTLNEVRIAITEEGRLAELFIDFPDKERLIGNIYLGKVNKVIQGINAAFVNIGFNQDAFLHFSDVDESLENFITEEDDDSDDSKKKSSKKPNPKSKSSHKEDSKKKTPHSKQPTHSKKEDTNKDLDDKSAVALRQQKYKSEKHKNSRTAVFSTKKHGEFEISIEQGQTVIVQIVREAYGNKGVKVTTKIGIPGRNLVLLPFDGIVGISKKITQYNDRRRLRRLAKSVLPEGYGLIVRTAARKVREEDLQRELESLIDAWRDVEKKVNKGDAPILLHQDMHAAGSVIRDLFTPDVVRVVIDSKKLYKEITGYLKSVSPLLLEKVELYSKKAPIFDTYGIEKDLAETYNPKIHLPSGGSIVIEQTEAMLVIDVNSGRSNSSEDQEVNAYKTNMEALVEIARQIRLRDNAGIILTDFIDMMNPKNRMKIFNEMKKELYRDRAITVAYPLTQLNLMQITRQRINQNISEKLSEVCPTCQGTGRVISKGVLVNFIERWLKNFRSHSREFRVTLVIHPHIANYLTEGTISKLSRLMIKYFVKIKVQQSSHNRIDEYKFYSQKHQKDITQEYMP
jgi:ribonuclease G